MPKPFSISLSISVLPSIRRDTSFKSSSRLARLILAVWGGFVLLGLWLFVTARAQSSGQPAAPFQPCNPGPAVITRAHSSTGTLPNHVITAASDPLCTNADLSVAKTVNNAILDVGEAITYTVMVTNAGPDDATGVQLTDVLPESVTFGSVAPQDSCTETNGTVICDLGSLPNDATAAVTIVVTPTNAGTITNMASVTGNESDPCPSNNTTEKTDRVTGADLVVTKTVNITAPKVGDVITYTITAANRGPGDATGVRLTDVLPAGVTFGGYTATQGIYSSTTGLWDVKNDLPANVIATLTITAAVNNCTGHLTAPNTASISANWPNDPNPGNNESRAVITPTSGVYCLYLPIIFKNYEPLICTPYFDDFSDPNRDSNRKWEIKNNGYVQLDYTVRLGNSPKEKYFVYNKVQELRVVQAPVDFVNRYSVEADVYWGIAGYEYGLIFGQADGPEAPAYRFVIDPVSKRYRLKYGNRNGWECINKPDPCWDDSPFTYPTFESNHLKVECNGTTISLYVNNNPDPLWQDIAPYPCSGLVGLETQAYPTPAQAYFDNFQVSCPFE